MDAGVVHVALSKVGFNLHCVSHDCLGVSDNHTTLDQIGCGFSSTSVSSQQCITASDHGAKNCFIGFSGLTIGTKGSEVATTFVGCAVWAAASISSVVEGPAFVPVMNGACPVSIACFRNGGVELMRYVCE